jgi:hypothetical protein
MKNVVADLMRKAASQRKKDLANFWHCKSRLCSKQNWAPKEED